jgi:SCP-2 sterol transfer family
LKVKPSRDKLKSALRDDPEFRVFARYWSGSLRFDIGDDVYLIKIKDGEVSAVNSQAPAKSGSGDVVITAPADDWAEFLKPLPEPWYHEFYPASAHHGFRLGGDPDYLWPYYTAIRRSGEILQSLATIEKE